MKCYYPIDSAGNRIGFKTPEACVYDASGTSLTTKLAQINSNINESPTATTISSSDTSCSNDVLTYFKWKHFIFIRFVGHYKFAAINTPYVLYKLPYTLLTNNFQMDDGLIFNKEISIVMKIAYPGIISLRADSIYTANEGYPIFQTKVYPVF